MLFNHNLREGHAKMTEEPLEAKGDDYYEDDEEGYNKFYEPIVEESAGGILVFVIGIVLMATFSSWNNVYRDFNDSILQGKPSNIKSSLFLALGVSGVLLALAIAAGLDFQHLFNGHIVKKRDNRKD